MTMTETTNKYFYKPTYGVDRGQAKFDQFVGKFDVCDAKYGRVLHLGDPALGTAPSGWQSGTGDISDSYLQGALDYAYTNGYAYLYIPEGTYLIATKRIEFYPSMSIVGAGCGVVSTASYPSSMFITASGFSTDFTANGYCLFTSKDAITQTWRMPVFRNLRFNLSSGPNGEIYAIMANTGMGSSGIQDCVFYSSINASKTHGGVFLPRQYTDPATGEKSGGALDHNFFYLDRCAFFGLGSVNGAYKLEGSNNCQQSYMTNCQFLNNGLNVWFGGEKGFIKNCDFYGAHSTFGGAWKWDTSTHGFVGYFPRIYIANDPTPTVKPYTRMEHCYFDGMTGGVGIMSDQRNALITANSRVSTMYGPYIENCTGIGGPSSVASLSGIGWKGVADVAPATEVTAVYSDTTHYVVEGLDVRGTPYYYNVAGGLFMATNSTTKKRKIHKIASASYGGGNTTITIDPLTDDGGSNYDYLMTDTPVTLRRLHDAPTFSVTGTAYREFNEPTRFNNAIRLLSGDDPSAAITNEGLLYTRITGGKMELCIQFPTGAVQVIKTEA